MLGETVFVCVYDQVTDPGSNAQYRIVSFVAVRIIDLVLGGEQGDQLESILVRVEGMVSAPDSETGGDYAPNLCKIYLAG